MISQYPHKLKFNKNIQSQEPFKDDSGHIIMPPPIWVTVEIDCRLEVNDKGRVVRSNDNENVEFGFIAYMPLGFQDVAYNQTVEVFDGDKLIGKGEVKRFSRGQLNARLWV